MKVLHVATGLSDEASGVTVVVKSLVQAQRSLGLTSGIIALGGTATGDPEADRLGGSGDHPPLRAWDRIAASPSLRRAIGRSDAAIFHVHGLWRMPNVYPGQAASRLARPMLVSPHGMLASEAFAFSKAQKMLFWHAVQRRALSALTCWHATSEAECADIRRFGQRQPIAILPNGIDVAIEPPVTERTKEVLYLGRLHPVKGIDLLLEAWARIEARHPGWRLRIVGPDEDGHAGHLRTLAERLELRNVAFDGPLFGAAKRAAYRRASLFVLPTINENFGMVVAEALAEGTPVICTRGAPWQGLEAHRCGWWVARDTAILAETIAGAMTKPAGALSEMGARGHAWMARDFAWDRIAASMMEVYRWCMGEQNQPNCVVID